MELPWAIDRSYEPNTLSPGGCGGVYAGPGPGARVPWASDGGAAGGTPVFAS